MTATLAKLLAHSMVVLPLLTLGACGGRSVSHDTEDGGTKLSADGPMSKTDSCVTLCEECGIDVTVRAASCEDFCREVDRQAVDAECGTVLDDFVRCRNGAADACSLRACPDQTNRLTVCVLSYCDAFSDSARALCSAW
jgi:hypothetical protein